MSSHQSRRRLNSSYGSIPHPGSSPFVALQSHRHNAHKAVDLLQITGDTKLYISANSNASYLTAGECLLVSKDKQSNVSSVDHYVRRVISVLNDRVSALWSIRESNSQTKVPILNAKYMAVGMLFRELLSVLDLFQRLLVSVTCVAESFLAVPDNNSCTRPHCSQHQLIALLHLLKHLIEQVVPSLQTRLDNFVVQLVRDTTTENMRQYCRAHPRDFLVLQRTHSKVLHTLYGIIGVQSTHAERKKQSEVVLFSLLRDHSIHPVYTSIALTCDVPTTQHYTSLALNATLTHFLRYLLMHEERFDEPGVYQLFRTILKLQEYIGDVKKELNMAASQKLVQDSSVWRRAECIVQVLNSEVFSVVSAGSAKHTKSGIRGTNTTQNSSEQNHNTTISASISNSSILSNNEQIAWRKLVGVQKRRQSLTRQRHKGTVFVTLELDLNNL